MSEVKGIRSFDEQDWMNFAGAEKFNQYDGPITLDFELSFNAEGVIVADKHGIEIHLNDNAGEPNVWRKDVELTRLRAEGELRALAKLIGEIGYAPDLAYELDHPTKEATKGFKWNL